MKTKAHFLQLLFATAVTLLGFTTYGQTASKLMPAHFDFSGKVGGLGSEGASVTHQGGNTFVVTLGHAPTHNTWPNKLNCFIKQAAKDVALRLIVKFDSGTRDYAFNEYFQSYSYDRITWHPVQWRQNRNTSPKCDTLDFPTFQADSVWIGTQVPFSYQDYLLWQSEQINNPNCSMSAIGRSQGGNYIFRLTITGHKSKVPEKNRWGLYFASQHPGEHNAHRRMQGMVDFLFSDSGQTLLDNTICHFVFYMSPDAPAKGWYRVAADGKDMNRTYSVTGPNAKTQPQEAFQVQRDLERISQTPTGLDAVWSVDTWPGLVDIGVRGINQRESAQLGSWQRLSAFIKRFDGAKLIKPIYLAKPEAIDDVMWAGGPAKRHGASAYLCEGGGSITSEYDNRLSGWIIMKALNSYYNKPKQP